MRLLCVFKVMLVLPAVQPGGPTTKVKARTGHDVARTLWHVPTLGVVPFLGRPRLAEEAASYQCRRQ
jgi:hypothetical protein